MRVGSLSQREMRLGPVLIQLPPNLKYDEALLKDFLATLPKDVRCAFEFRHASWLNDAVYAMLEQQGAALCMAESDHFVSPEVVTGGFVYCRLRKSQYTPEDLAGIKEKVLTLVDQGKDVYVFFKHEDTPEGALNAEELLR